MTDVVPDATPPGGTRTDLLEHSDHALVAYPDGSVRFRHRCDRGPRGVIVCAPALQLGRGHTITRDAGGRPTVSPSILCDDCGTHGWATDGAWRDA